MSVCKQCDDLAARFPLDSRDHNSAGRAYFWAFRALRERARLGALDFLAGDCPPDDIETHIDREDLYIMRHYFQCRCKRIFYIGYCCRGTPLGRIVHGLPRDLAQAAGDGGESNSKG